MHMDQKRVVIMAINKTIKNRKNSEFKIEKVAEYKLFLPKSGFETSCLS